MSKCTKCHHDCHCNGELHGDVYGTCACGKCNCKPKAFTTEDDFCVGDDSGECESCQ